MTVLFIGGAHQGKEALARQWYPQLACVPNLQDWVKNTLEKGENPENLLNMLFGKVVVCNEIGCGIVPLDPADEAWREAVGRLCCALAAQADVVVRVIAGVPQWVKGDAPCI